jgi:hypothetical protein
MSGAWRVLEAGKRRRRNKNGAYRVIFLFLLVSRLGRDRSEVKLGLDGRLGGREALRRDNTADADGNLRALSAVSLRCSTCCCRDVSQLLTPRRRWNDVDTKRLVPRLFYADVSNDNAQEAGTTHLLLMLGPVTGLVRRRWGGDRFELLPAVPPSVHPAHKSRQQGTVIGHSQPIYSQAYGGAD